MGMVMSRRATGSAFARRVISASSTWIYASSARKVPTSTISVRDVLGERRSGIRTCARAGR